MRDTALALIAIFTIFNFWCLCVAVSNLRAIRKVLEMLERRS